MISQRLKRFIEEYLIDLNGAAAAVRTGIASSHAKIWASKQLARPEIRAAVNAAIEARAKRTKVTQDYVLDNLKEIVERCMQRAPVMTRDGQKQQADGRFVWEFDASGANKALELIGRHLKMFTDKHELAGADGKPIKVTLSLGDGKPE